MSNRGQSISYKSSAFYWRKDIRDAVESGDIATLAEIAEALTSELVDHKTFIRERGYWPPKNRVSASEAAVKPKLFAPHPSEAS